MWLPKRGGIPKLYPAGYSGLSGYSGYGDIGGTIPFVPSDLIPSVRSLLAQSGIPTTALADTGEFNLSGLSVAAVSKLSSLMGPITAMVDKYRMAQAQVTKAKAKADAEAAQTSVAPGAGTSISEKDAINAALFVSGLIENYVVGQPVPIQAGSGPMAKVNSWLNETDSSGVTNADRLRTLQQTAMATYLVATGVGAALLPLIPVFYTGMKTLEDLAFKYVGQGAGRMLRAFELGGAPGLATQAASEAISEYGIGGTIILTQAAIWAVTVPFVGWVIGGALAVGYLILHGLFGGESDEEKKQREIDTMYYYAARAMCGVQPEVCVPNPGGAIYRDMIKVPTTTKEATISWWMALRNSYCAENPGAWSGATVCGPDYPRGEQSLVTWAIAKRQAMLKDIADKFIAASVAYNAKVQEMKRAALAADKAKATVAAQKESSGLLVLGAAGAGFVAGGPVGAIVGGLLGAALTPSASTTETMTEAEACAAGNANPILCKAKGYQVPDANPTLVKGGKKR